jgi:hypothetical protein
MVNISTLSLSPSLPEIQNNQLKPYKKQIVRNELVPSEETIQNILNYSKSLEVTKSSKLGLVMANKN